MRPLIITLPLLLSACAPTLTTPMAGPGTAAGVTVVADLALRDAAGRAILETVTPWASGDIVSAIATLHPETGTEVLATVTFTQADIQANKKAQFANLKMATKYRIVTTAFAADSLADADTAPDPIEDPDVTTCTTAFETTNESVFTITGGINLKLRNKTFSGSTGNGLNIVGGGLAHDGFETAN
jgi:hypothetical protein